MSCRRLSGASRPERRHTLSLSKRALALEVPWLCSPPPMDPVIRRADTRESPCSKASGRAAQTPNLVEAQFTHTVHAFHAEGPWLIEV